MSLDDFLRESLSDRNCGIIQYYSTEYFSKTADFLRFQKVNVRVQAAEARRQAAKSERIPILTKELLRLSACHREYLSRNFYNDKLVTPHYRVAPGDEVPGLL